MNKSIKNIIITVVIGVIAIGGVSYVALSKSKDSKDKNTNVYQTATVEKGNLKVQVSASSVAVPKNKVNPDFKDLELQMSVDELDVVNLKKDQTVNIDINAFPDKTYKGKIEDISEKGNVLNGVTSYPVTVSLDKDIKGLKDGMTGTCTITTENKKDTLFVPIEAINIKDDGTNYVINPEDSKEIKVTTGIHNDDYIEITKGLNKGDKVQLPTLAKTSNQMAPPFMNK
ncbi:efflux RND transporter periplasmic adaptor subunit [Clostridium chrysemydis]|uniref:efflux RND transporter periplasmic adaptor subunit n=1 Tax=Clostridium chrysemydis TaxID=2665504 RepID=UPI0018841D12|nr:HlyD family efflux transporter periplasmic adaptor subunit [Clostridium chrysemydis]